MFLAEQPLDPTTMKSSLIDPDTDLAHECYALVYAPSPNRKRFPENCVEVKATEEEARAAPILPGGVCRPCCSVLRARPRDFGCSTWCAGSTRRPDSAKKMPATLRYAGKRGSASSGLMHQAAFALRCLSFSTSSSQSSVRK